MPVATTLMRILPFIFSSKAEPKIIFALSSTSFLMVLTAMSASNKVMSGPPVILTNTPLAPRIEISSRSGLEIAASQASTALFSPSASPVPIIALPILVITVRISAKSRFTSPGIVIRSVTPRTPAFKTSSAILNADSNVVLSLAILNKFWFGITISVSTHLLSSSIPFSAVSMRYLPSKWKGLVTTPTVRMSLSLASFAITGAAPVPVPPPIPAAMKTMWLPSRSFSISSIFSSAAARPRSGKEPAPRPLVVASPSWILFSASEYSNACASVLAATNSTPSRPELIILLIALPPAPPTPKIVILGLRVSGLGISIFKAIVKLLINLWFYSNA